MQHLKEIAMFANSDDVTVVAFNLLLKHLWDIACTWTVLKQVSAHWWLTENFFENGINLMSITRWFLTLEPWIANLVRHNTSLVSLFCYLKMFHFEKAHLVYKDEKKYYVVKIIAPLRLEKICLPLSQKKKHVYKGLKLCRKCENYSAIIYIFALFSEKITVPWKKNLQPLV